MNHILKKLQVAGAGKNSQKPKPPIFLPPNMGELQYGASFSYAETIDLISDGPIAGLVNPLGRVMEGMDILQGIYLNDTAIAIGTDPSNANEMPSAEEEELTFTSMSLDSGAGTGIRALKSFGLALLDQKHLSQDGKISTLYHNGERGEVSAEEAVVAPSHISMFFQSRRAYFSSRETATPLVTLYIRAFMNDALNAQRFFWYLDGQLNYGGDGDNQLDASFRDEHFPRGGTERESQLHADAQSRPQSLYWTDASTLAASKFFWGFGHPTVQDGQFTRTTDSAENFVREEIAEILALWNNSRNTLSPDTFNLYQRDLAAKALRQLGWTVPQTEDNANNVNTAGLLTKWIKDGGEERGSYFIVKVEEDNPNLSKNILDEEGTPTVVEEKTWGALKNMKTLPWGDSMEWLIQNSLRGGDLLQHLPAGGCRYMDCTCPTIDDEGNLTGKMHGFIVVNFPHGKIENTLMNQGWYIDAMINDTFLFVSNAHRLWSNMPDLLANIATFEYAHQRTEFNMPISPPSPSVNRLGDSKFNYNNVLAELKKGEETQTPLRSFQRIFIDHFYNKELFGPYGTRTRRVNSVTGADENTPQRLAQNEFALTREKVLSLTATNFNLGMAAGLPIEEGSDDTRNPDPDERGVEHYSSWGGNSLITWEEQALPCMHTVYNPNVTQVFITLNIQALSDTLPLETDPIGPAGTKFPTVLNIKVETGIAGKYENGAIGGETVVNTYTFRIVALIEGQTLIDIGNPDSSRGSGRDFILDIGDTRTDLSVPFELPPVNIADHELETGIEAGTIDQDSVEKRFVRVTKLSYETNSVLLDKVVSLNKVTEIINSNMPYPLSAIVGTKLDSRAFGSIPKRTYDCKLKLVKIPNNYNPSKRYYNTIDEFDAASKGSKQIYEGDWDGRFNPELQWTDNPAWILYDLLTNNRYGMGNHVDANKINKWQLYKIGRFCDAVDDNGSFEGVTDGRGGLEPRFSCNIVFERGQKLYDAITTITNIFRGRVFFGNSEINFVDDRPREPINLFTNESVKEGQFYYSNNRRDQQFNTIEISFKDRFDNFSPKVEVIEDEEDIRERGVFKTRIQGVGITSRAMARRVGQHTIFSSIDENQTVAFTAGLESLLCQPGDLITIEDELKTNKANFGKILAVDPTNETIRISNSFDGGDMLSGKFTVYNPTGRDTIEEIRAYDDIYRVRYDSFTVTGVGAPWIRYTGDYQFSGYTPGYDTSAANGDLRYQQYGLYTGVSGTFLYFQTAVTGWTFASGTGAGNVGAFDLASGDFIAEETGAQNLVDFNTGKIAPMVMTGTRRESAGVTFSGFDLDSFIGNQPYGGVQDSEISNASPDQMAVLSVTGKLLSTATQLQLEGFSPYGSLLSGFDKPHLLPFVKLGSPAKFEIRDASPFLYKVIAMKENAPNEYLISATKYDTGKFNLIEKSISIENKADTYSYQVAQTINGTTYTTLASPTLETLTTGIPDAAADTFSITGMWSEVEDGTGYNVRLTQPNGSVISESVTTTGHRIGGLSQVGVFNFCVNALGNNGVSPRLNFFDSSYDCEGMFVVYDELLVFNRSFVNQITIL